MTLDFEGLIFVFFAAMVACVGWYAGTVLLAQLSHIAARILRRLRGREWSDFVEDFHAASQRRM